VLQQVVEKYPKAPAAKSARESLRSLTAEERKKPAKR
jgi:TolA-binding protein